MISLKLKSNNFIFNQCYFDSLIIIKMYLSGLKNLINKIKVHFRKNDAYNYWV